MHRPTLVSHGCSSAVDPGGRQRRDRVRGGVFGATGRTCRPICGQAVLLLAAHYYENRHAMGERGRRISGRGERTSDALPRCAALRRGAAMSGARLTRRAGAGDGRAGARTARAASSETWSRAGTLWAEIRPGAGKSGRRTSPTSEPGGRIGSPCARHRSARRRGRAPDQRFREGARVCRILAVTEADADRRLPDLLRARGGGGMSYGMSAALQAAIFQTPAGRCARWRRWSAAAIYDVVPAGQVPGTYVSLGPEDVRDRSDKTGRGCGPSISRSAWSPTRRGSSSAKTVAGGDSDALDGRTPPLVTRAAGHASVSAGPARSGSARRENRRIDLTFRARVEDD